MPYDEELDARVAEVALPWGAERKTMFGGTGYLVNGNMMAGVHKDRLVVRLSAEGGEAALKEPFVKVFDITRKPMAGWITVEAGGLDDESLARWLAEARAHVETLPPK